MANSKQPLCILPWVHVYTHPSGQLLSCCSGRDTTMGHSNGQMEQALNHPLMKELRRALLNGQWHPNCTMCQEREAMGAKSSRTTANRIMGKFYETVNPIDQEGTLPEPKLLYIDLRLSNLCNFKCRTCNFTNSSAWYEDELALNGQVSLSPPGEDHPILAQKKVIYPNIDFTKLSDQLSFVKRIDFVGGEPFLDPKLPWVLDQLIEKGRTNDVVLNFITNLSLLISGGEAFLSKLSEFRSIHFTVSLDGYGDKAEYIRSGTRWHIIENHLQYLRTQLSHVSFNIHFTYSLLNAFHILDFHRWLTQVREIAPQQFVLNLLVGPEYYRADILPPAMRRDLIDQYKKYNETIPLDSSQRERSSFDSVISFLEKSPHDENSSRDQLKIFFEKNDLLDQRRKEAFENVFPEYQDLRSWTFRS